MKGVDFGQTAGDYAKHRAGVPDSLFARLAAFDVGRAGQRIVDLGAGTGTLARGLARRGARVTAVDRSASMLAAARDLDRAAGVTVDYVEARAEQTGLAERSFEAVTSAQAWHWFDGPRAAAEAHRLLVPRGRLALVYHDWVIVPGNLCDVTEALVVAHNPAWTLRDQEGLKGMPFWMKQLSVAGFVDHELFSYDEPVAYTHESWRGRLRASAGIGASLPPDAVARFDAELQALLARDYPTEVLAIPHRVTVLVTRSA